VKTLCHTRHTCTAALLCVFFRVPDATKISCNRIQRHRHPASIITQLQSSPHYLTLSVLGTLNTLSQNRHRNSLSLPRSSTSTSELEVPWFVTSSSPALTSWSTVQLGASSERAGLVRWSDLARLGSGCSADPTIEELVSIAIERSSTLR
jgi:hypothetical protein